MNDENRKLIDSLSEQNGDYDYFKVKFEIAGDKKLSKETILYVDFDMQKDFTMAIGKDSTLPSICQRIPNGHSNSYEYILAFEKRKGDNNEDFALIYKDEIFSIGTLAFTYKQDDIKKIPTLATK
jgi:hypothetical protein